MQIEQYGLVSVLPHTKKLSGTPFWEIRVLGRDNLRVIYFSPIKDSVVILHGFNKKTKKTPPKEIETVFDRFSDWKTNH